MLEAWATDTVVHRKLGTDEPFVLGFVRVTDDVVDRGAAGGSGSGGRRGAVVRLPEEVLETVSLGCQPDAGFVTGVASTTAGVSLYLSATEGGSCREVSGGGEFDDRQLARRMHSYHVEAARRCQRGELRHTAFTATEVGQHPQVHLGGR